MTLTYTETDTTSSASWTSPGWFSGTDTVNIGSASADRIVVVCICGFSNSAPNLTPSSVTLNGSAMTQAAASIGTDTGGSPFGMWIYYLPLATGTTATLAFNAPFTQGVFVTVGIITGDVNAVVGATAVVTNAQTSDPHAISATVPSGGVAVVTGAIWNVAGPLSWTGASQDLYFFDAGATSFDAFFAAHGTASTASFTGANNQFVQMVMATFGPSGGGSDTLFGRQQMRLM